LGNFAQPLRQKPSCPAFSLYQAKGRVTAGGHFDILPSQGTPNTEFEELKRIEEFGEEFLSPKKISGIRSRRFAIVA
jgi:hypothetical protein